MKRPTASSITPAAKVGAAAIMLAVSGIYLLRLDRTAGLMVDDAWYVLLGKALADGQVFGIISSPLAPILPIVPPGFPFLLSVLFRLSPQFPENVWLLKSLSIAAMLGVGLVGYSYLSRYRHLPRDLAACAAVALAIMPAFVFLATSAVMTECVFTLSQLVAVVLVHRSVETDDERTARRFVVLAAMMAAATMLIRSAGVTLAAAAALWLLKEQRWRRMVLLSAVLIVCLAPWMLYARAHASTPAQRAEHGGSIVYTYGDQFWMRWAGAPAFGQITLRDLPGRVRDNLVTIFGRDMGGILMPTLFRGSSESGEEVFALGGAAGLSAASMGGAAATMTISFFLSGLVLLGFIQTVRERLTVAELLVALSLIPLVVWPFWTFRFVLPLTPYLFLYFVVGLQAMTRWARSWKGSATGDLSQVPRIALLCIIGLSLYDHVGYVRQMRQTTNPDAIDWTADAHEVDAVLDWMNRSLGTDGGLATTNSALVYLRTGRKGVMFDDPTKDWSRWKKRGIRYIASLMPLDLPPASHGEYKLLYQSPRGRLWVIEI